MQHSISQDNTSSDAKLTRVLLLCGVVAGPLYVIVGVIEMLTRPGFDPTRHDLSLMSNGDWGWIHISLLILTGLLTIAGAVGMRRVLRGGRGGTWGPILLGIYGLGLIGAGFFTADPALGFPPGTPADAHAISWHGLLHFICGGIGFLGLIAACFVFARRFAAQRQRGWVAYSVATGVIYLAAFAGIAVGSNSVGVIMTIVILAFSVAVVLGWAWVSAMAVKLLSEGA
jgi:drug/metabolite transporter (DMT)-like permease